MDFTASLADATSLMQTVPGIWQQQGQSLSLPEFYPLDNGDF